MVARSQVPRAANDGTSCAHEARAAVVSDVRGVGGDVGRDAGAVRDAGGWAVARRTCTRNSAISCSDFERQNARSESASAAA